MCALLRATPRYLEHNKADFKREERMRVPAPIPDWQDRETGIRFSYQGASVAGPDDDAEDGDELLITMRADMRKLLQDVVDELGPNADEESVLRVANERAHGLVSSYNEQISPDLGGLSPASLSRLLGPSWGDPDSVIRLNRHLPLERIADAPILQQQRALLALAHEQKGLPATLKGNLSVATVKLLAGDVWLERHYPPRGETKPRIIEEEVWPVHRARILADLAGLIQKRKVKFMITRKARDLSGDTHAGELYALLFETAFKRFNFAYATQFGPEWPELQSQVAFTLYRIRTLPAVWRTAQQIMDETVLPFILAEAPSHTFADWLAYAFERRVLKLLVDFALLEHREETTVDSAQTEWYRKTPLYDEFLEISL